MQQYGGSADYAKVAISINVASYAGAIFIKASGSMRRMYDDTMECSNVAGKDCFSGADVAFACRLVVSIVLDEGTIRMQELLIRL